MTVLQKKPASQIAHLTDEDIEVLGKELDAIRQEVLDSRGARDAAYIRRVIDVQRKLELGITSLAELGEVLRPVDAAAINERMDYRYPPGAVRRLDDALLVAFGERYVGLHGNAHREASLRARLGKIQGDAEGRPGQV